MLINHVTVLVSDKGIAEDFYVNKLGLEKNILWENLYGLRLVINSFTLHRTQGHLSQERFIILQFALRT